MAPVLDATPGGAASNSYVTLAAASALLAERLDTAPWFALGGIPAAEVAQATPWLLLDGAAQQTAALLSATRLLEEQVQWYGQPASLTQALSWPMTGQVDHRGRPVPADTVPLVVQRATASYALELLRFPRDVAAGTSTAGVKSLKLGETTVVYQDTAVPSAVPSVGLPAEIRQLLRPYGRLAGGIMVPLLRT